MTAIRSIALSACWVLMIHWTSAFGFSQDDTPQVIIYLKSGAQIQGKLLAETKEEGRSYVVFRTASGGTWKLEKGRVVRRIKPVDPLDQEYLNKLTQLPDTADDHWSMYNWLTRQPNGKARFKREREFHLQRILELDPTDDRASNLLQVREVNGRMVDKKLLYAYHGYISVGGKWLPEKQIEINMENDAVRQQNGERNKALRRWKKNTLGKQPRDVVEKELFQLVDAPALPIVDTFMSKEKNPQVRRLYIEAIGRIPTGLARDLLIKYAIYDTDDGVRDRAESLLQQEAYDPFQSVASAAKYLGSTKNPTVRRAARLIGIIGAENAPFYLKDALVTEHVVATGNQPGRTGATFSDGQLQSFGAGGGPATRKIQVNNDEALDAIRTLTGEDYGFDEEKWKKWYVDMHTSTERDLRRD